MHQFEADPNRQYKLCLVCGQQEADRSHLHEFDRALYQTTMCKCGLHIDATCHIVTPTKNPPTPYQKRAS